MADLDFYSRVNKLQDVSKDIINSETDRLNKKKQGIDAAYASQQRMVSLNQSYSMRMRAWSYLIAIISVAIVLSIVLGYSRNIIPDFIVDILTILVLAGAIIWSYLIYVDIQKREENDFNVLSMKSSSLLDPNNIISNGNTPAMSGNTTTDISSLFYGSTCIGSQCCGNNLKYDTVTNSCVVPTATGAGAISTTN
jgi:hypothetical protein